MKRKNPIAIISTLLFAFSIAWANPSIEREVRSANQAYQAGDFAEAARQYNALLRQGYRSEALFYNLGNSYFRMDSLGKAVLNYERALLLDPNDADVLHNLDVVKNQLPEELESLPKFFLTAGWNHLSLSLSANAWSVLALVAVWLGVGGFVIWLIGKERRNKKIGFIAGVVLIISASLFFALAQHRTQLETNSHRLVVLENTVNLYSAPDEQSENLRALYEGTTLNLLDQIGAWYKVSLPDGSQGWLEQSTVEEI